MMKPTMFALAFVAALATAQSPAKQDLSAAEKTFAECKRLVGGVWRGVVGDKIPVEFRYTLIDGGKVLQGDGIVGDPKKPMLVINSQIGIDPTAKEVFYLDRHSGTTIYFGHFTTSKDGLELNFKGISADTGTYFTSMKLSGKDEYSSTTFLVEADGKKKKLHDIAMKRTAE